MDIERVWIYSELLQGVLQGLVLGPLPFNIYYTEVCNFADDTAFFVCDKDPGSLIIRLEHNSLLAIEWLQSNYMKLDEEKCHLVV